MSAPMTLTPYPSTFAMPGAAMSNGRYRSGAEGGVVSFWRESLSLVEQHVSFARRKVRADDELTASGMDIAHLLHIHDSARSDQALTQPRSQGRNALQRLG